MTHKLKLGNSIVEVELRPMSERPEPEGFSTSLDMWLAYSDDGSYTALAHDGKNWIDPLGFLDLSNLDNWLGWCTIPTHESKSNIASEPIKVLAIDFYHTGSGDRWMIFLDEDKIQAIYPILYNAIKTTTHVNLDIDELREYAKVLLGGLSSDADGNRRKQIRLEVFKQFQMTILSVFAVTAIIMYIIFPMREATIALAIVFAFVEFLATGIIFISTLDIED